MWNSVTYFSSAGLMQQHKLVMGGLQSILRQTKFIGNPHTYFLVVGLLKGQPSPTRGRPRHKSGQPRDMRNLQAHSLSQADEPTQADHDSARTPIQVVAAEGLVELLGLLPSPGIDAAEQADEGRTLIQVAVSEEYVESTSGAQSSYDGPGRPSVDSIKYHGYRGTCVVRTLTFPAWAIHADDGQTPVRMAPQQGYEDVARALPDPVTETVVHDDQRWCRYIVP